MTKGQDRRFFFFMFLLSAIFAHLIFYVGDRIQGDEFFVGAFGWFISWALISMLEFKDDEELIDKNKKI